MPTSRILPAGVELGWPCQVCGAEAGLGLGEPGSNPSLMAIPLPGQLVLSHLGCSPLLGSS